MNHHETQRQCTTQSPDAGLTSKNHFIPQPLISGSIVPLHGRDCASPFLHNTQQPSTSPHAIPPVKK